MSRVLVTGATGNVGLSVIKHLVEGPHTVVAGVRDVIKAKHISEHFPKVQLVEFDFEKNSTFENSMRDIDLVFLLRPPHLSQVTKVFRPLIAEIKRQGIRAVVFLSVQGAERSRVIPHNRIEKTIREHSLDFVFLRPSYFMQNLTTTLSNEIRSKQGISLPAGNAKFNWVDVDNIGEVAAIVINDFSNFKNKSLEITGPENINFYTVADLLSASLNKTIQYQPTNLWKFYRMKRNEGMPNAMILVMFMLHFIPRFQEQPVISPIYTKLTGKKPTTLKEFIDQERYRLV